MQKNGKLSVAQRIDMELKKGELVIEGESTLQKCNLPQQRKLCLLQKTPERNERESRQTVGT